MTFFSPNHVNFEIVENALRAMADYFDYEFYLIDNESMIVEDHSGFKLEVILYQENNIISMKCSTIADNTNSIEHAHLVCNHLNNHTPLIRFSALEIPKMGQGYRGTEILIKSSHDTFYDKGLHLDQFIYNAHYLLTSSKSLVNKNF